MATERMYELAFRYKKAKLWQRMFDSELFAVKLSDGKIGYCSIMGRMGERGRCICGRRGLPDPAEHDVRCELFFR